MKCLAQGHNDMLTAVGFEPDHRFLVIASLNRLTMNSICEVDKAEKQSTLKILLGTGWNISVTPKD